MITNLLRRSGIATAVIAVVISSPPRGASASHETPHNGTIHDYGDMADYDLAFPVIGKNNYSDSFFAARGTGIHHATDIMAAKMTPVVAAHDGVVTMVNGSGNQSWVDSYGRGGTPHITHSDGWESVYIHLNNDTPGTHDGPGGGIAPHLPIRNPVH